MSFQGMSRSIDPMGQRTRRDTAWKPHPAPIVSISLQPGIPWRVALPQSPPPLPRPWTSMQQSAGKANLFPANGNLSPICWSHQTTALQPVPYLLVSPNDRTASWGEILGRSWGDPGEIGDSSWGDRGHWGDRGQLPNSRLGRRGPRFGLRAGRFDRSSRPA